MPEFSACAHFTKTGTHSAVNQDSAAAHTSTLSSGTISYAAVFDGHSAFGEVAARTARVALTELMVTEMPWDEDPEGSMRNLMKSLNDAVLAAHNPDLLPEKHKHTSGGETYTYALTEDKTAFTVTSPKSEARVVPVDFGCTAAVAVFTHARRLVVGNLGDSVVLLCYAGGDDDLSIKKLSMPHSAASPEEISRIEAACGASVKVADGYLQGLQEPVKGLALQPTRGLGHPVWAKFGISADPYVVTVAATKTEGREAFGVVVLSDGVSDILSEESIIDTCAQSETAEDAARQLVEEAAAFADLDADGKDRDDATAAVIFW